MKEDTYKKYIEGKDLFDKGEKCEEIAKKLKISRVRFQKWLKENYNYKLKKDSSDLYIKGEEMYLKGYSQSQICKELKIGKKQFRNWLINKNIKIVNPSKKYTYNENFFENINTEEKAYWLGFLYADGCITNKPKRHLIDLELSYIDKNHIEKFKTNVNSNAPIHIGEIKLNNKIFKRARFRLCGNKIVNDIINKGCVPNKSLILTFPNENIVPKHLIHHFIRGYVDGDGSIMLSTDKKKGRLQIIGTKEFLLGIIKETKWRNNKMGRQGKAYSIDYNGFYVKDYLDYLYKDATIYLDRKYKKYLKICCLNSTPQKN